MPPAVMMGVGSALGGAAGSIPAALGAGKSGFQARDNEVDGSAYQYGGNTREQAAADAAASAYARASAEAAQAAATYGPNSWQAQEARQRQVEAESAAKWARDDADKAGTFAEQDIARAEKFGEAKAGVKADMSNANASRVANQGALTAWQNYAQGNGPTAAQGMLQQGTDRAIAGASSLAASARGGGLASAAARRQAMGQQGELIAGQGAQAAQLRAQEQQAGMTGWTNALASQRAQDATEAFGQAGLDESALARDDARRAYFEGQRTGVRRDVTAAGIAREEANRQSRIAADQTNAGVAAGNAAADARNINTAVQAPLAGAIGGEAMYNRYYGKKGA